VSNHHAHLLLGQAGECLRARARRQNGKLALEELRDQGEHLGLVVDDEERRGRGVPFAHLVSTVAAGGASGTPVGDGAPAPGALVTWRSPPWRATSECAMGRPRPVPCPALVVKNGSKMRSWTSGAMPGPLSPTSTNTLPSSTRVRTRISPRPWIACTALV